jgi:hypothetical protein
MPTKGLRLCWLGLSGFVIEENALLTIGVPYTFSYASAIQTTPILRV